MAKAKDESVQKSYDEELDQLRKELKADDRPEDIYISSGSFTLDIHLGGRGWKCGRVGEIKAWEGSGKTTICLHLIEQCQKANLEYLYIDAEQALNPDYARKIGIDWEHFKKRLFQPANGEEGFETLKRIIKTGKCRVAIVDSTSGMLPQKMMEGEAGASNLGLHARLFSSEIPKIKHLADKYNTLVIFISQIREKIGVMFGSPETTQAGNALRFFDDYLIELRKSVDSANGKEEDATGITSKFHIIKNKTFEPYHKGEFHIIKMQGIDIVREVIDIADDLEIIKVWGKATTYPVTEEGTKYDTEEFYNILKDNPELMESIKHDCLVKLGLA